MAYFFRAVSLLQLDQFEEALSDLKNVDDDFLTYIDGYGDLTKMNLVLWANDRIKTK
jgi:hypothetical protein